MTQTQTEPRNGAGLAPAITDSQGGPVAVKPALRSSGGGVMPIIPRDIEAVYRAAQGIARAGWAPKSYGNDVDKIAIGIMHGMEVGFTPIAALQSIAVINGTPCIWGDGAMALAQASGMVEDFDEQPEMDKGTVVGFTCTVKRRDRKTPIVRKFSLTDATKAGLLSKDSPWKTYPQRMLQMRARSWALRDGFADVLRGLSIREEVEDFIELKPEKDGTFSVHTPEPAPPRPTRAETKAALFEAQMVDAVGEIIQFSDPQALAAAFKDAIGNAAERGLKALEDLMAENDGALETLLAAGRTGHDLASSVKDHYERAVAWLKEGNTVQTDADADVKAEAKPAPAIKAKVTNGKIAPADAKEVIAALKNILANAPDEQAIQAIIEANKDTYRAIPSGMKIEYLNAIAHRKEELGIPPEAN